MSDHGERRFVGLVGALRVLFVPTQRAEAELDQFHLELLVRVIGDRRELLEYTLRTTLDEIAERSDLGLDEARQLDERFVEPAEILLRTKICARTSGFCHNDKIVHRDSPCSANTISMLLTLNKGSKTLDILVGVYEIGCISRRTKKHCEPYPSIR